MTEDTFIREVDVSGESQKRARLKPDGIHQSDADLKKLQLPDIIDIDAIQSLVNDFYRLTNIPMSIIDLKGRILVVAGWRDICVKFHRVNKESLKRCLESDSQLSSGVSAGEFKFYKCWNGMWHMSTPLIVAGRKLANLFSSQYFFDEEKIDYAFFRAQARQYGFDEIEYLEAIERVPRISKEKLSVGMDYFIRLADLISRLSYANLKLRNAHDDLEKLVSERTGELTRAVDALQQEILEKSMAQNNLLRLNRLYALLSETNQIIVRAVEQETLFHEFCKAAIDEGGFVLAWVGMVEEQNGQVKMLASWGQTAFLDGILVTARNEPHGLGPAGTSIRNGNYYICNDFQNDPCTVPWHDRGRAHEIGSSASVAIKEEQRVVGVLSLYAKEKGFFDKQTAELLCQMGADISFALDNFRDKARCRDAEIALQNETLERLRTVETLRENERLLIQQSRLAAMGEMIGNIAHQWRQPLNQLALKIQQLQMYYENGFFSAKFLDEAIAVSMNQINHMSQTIDDFRNFFKPDKEKTYFSIKEVIAATFELLRDGFKNVHIELELQLLCFDEQMISGFPNEYSQVLLNILLNARDALLEKKPPSPKVTVTITEESGKSVVLINDNAGGIPDGIINKIFDPYFSTKGPQAGTGVGLFMSRIIIEKNMQGRLTVRNTDKGAEFRIEV